MARQGSIGACPEAKDDRAVLRCNFLRGKVWMPKGRTLWPQGDRPMRALVPGARTPMPAILTLLRAFSTTLARWLFYEPAKFQCMAHECAS